MKKMILGVVIGVLVGTASNVIASNLLASNIAYTPKDSTWGVNNVEAAIDSLKLSKTSDNYSTEEQVVGTWIDGKPIYQATVDAGSEIKVLLNGSWQDVCLSPSADIETIIDGKLSRANESYPYKSSYSSAHVISYNSNTNKIAVYAGNPGNGNYFYVRYCTIQYTKTTD